jgi:SAM-dependent methyltransferase
MNLASLYANRFDAEDQAWKRRVWRILWERVFSRHVRPDDTVLDLGAGFCEFINSAVARRKIAVDLSEKLAEYAGPGVEVHRTAAQDLSFLKDGEVDVVFTSNFLEHLPNKDVLASVVKEVRRVLKPGGKLVIMGPNIRYLPGLYWDYFDHHVALTERSLAELLAISAFELEEVIPRFLPYTVKSGGPRWEWLVRLYLAARPVAWNLLGKQFLVIARRPVADNG